MDDGAIGKNNKKTKGEKTLVVPIDNFILLKKNVKDCLVLPRFPCQSSPVHKHTIFMVLSNMLVYGLS